MSPRKSEMMSSGLFFVCLRNLYEMNVNIRAKNRLFIKKMI